MSRFSHSLWCGLAILTLAACGKAPVHGPAPPAKTSAPPDQLGRIVERYWDDRMSQGSAISPQLLADSLSIERRYLAEILAVPAERLDANSRLTYEIFKKQRELAIEGFTFPAELLPMNPFGGMPQHFAALAAATEQRPLASVADCESWLRRTDEYVRWTQQAIVNMREGTRRGYTSPRALIERMLPILERLGTDESANVFYVPLRTMQPSIADPERTRLSKMISSAVSQQLLPANRVLHDFLLNEYLPRARAGIAISELPLGPQWYDYRIKRATGTGLSADEIHRLGIAEVERIAARRQAPESAPAGAAAPAAGDLLNAYQELKLQVRAATPKLFSEIPSADFTIRAADGLSEPATQLSYQRPGPAGFPPAVLWVNSGRSAVRIVSIAGYLQQGEPGHLFQIALQQQRIDLPRFQRFGAEAAFIEGWGLYAALLGEELGVYSDDAARLDASAAEMRCAVALVVDTGIHAKGWTRARAFDYLHAHLAIDGDDGQALVDWFAANPADALACKMGELKIRAIRTRAQQSLGARFDVRDFHSEILKDGAMPMDILEAKMKLWMDARP
jgi:uncharacterized protein (DUF885 family)